MMFCNPWVIVAASHLWYIGSKCIVMPNTAGWKWVCLKY